MIKFQMKERESEQVLFTKCCIFSVLFVYSVVTLVILILIFPSLKFERNFPITCFHSIMSRNTPTQPPKNYISNSTSASKPPQNSTSNTSSIPSRSSKNTTSTIPSQPPKNTTLKNPFKEPSTSNRNPSSWENDRRRKTICNSASHFIQKRDLMRQGRIDAEKKIAQYKEKIEKLYAEKNYFYEQEDKYDDITSTLLKLKHKNTGLEEEFKKLELDFDTNKEKLCMQITKSYKKKLIPKRIRLNNKFATKNDRQNKNAAIFSTPPQIIDTSIKRTFSTGVLPVDKNMRKSDSTDFTQPQPSISESLENNPTPQPSISAKSPSQNSNSISHNQKPLPQPSTSHNQPQPSTSDNQPQPQPSTSSKQPQPHKSVNPGSRFPVVKKFYLQKF